MPVVQRDPQLTADCGEPMLQGDTWADIAALAVERKEALRECTARMRALRH